MTKPHLKNRRAAYVRVRQATADQLLDNNERWQRQYGWRTRLAGSRRDWRRYWSFWLRRQPFVDEPRVYVHVSQTTARSILR
jgi:hypothetical protein